MPCMGSRARRRRIMVPRAGRWVGVVGRPVEVSLLLNQIIKT